MSLIAAPLSPEDPMMQSLRIGPHMFPGAWGYTMPRELLGLRLPAERRATCMNCPKSCYENYRPDYRCCTYHPRIPNYLLGLASFSEFGPKIMEKILEKNLLLPEGMHHAPGQWVDYLDDLEHERFGQSESVLCPLLDRDTGYCTVHAFRNSVCSTFFCYKDHGATGDQFWQDVQVLGSQVEMSISQWAMWEIGFGVREYFRRFDQLAKDIKQTSSETGWSSSALDFLWGDWAHRKVELVQECARAVSANRDDLWQIANSFPIFESDAFNKAMIRVVPRRLKEQIDPDDLTDDTHDAARPKDLWKQVLKSYEKLWDLPEGFYELSSRANIVENKLDDDESRYYSKHPFCLNFVTRKGSKTNEWRQFISQDVAAVLEIFRQEGRVMDWRLLSETVVKNLTDAKGFLSEMIQQKVLVRRALH